MALEGNQVLHGLELENSYVHIIRLGCTKQYTQAGDTWIRLYNIDYDFGVFPSKAQYEIEPNNPIKKYFRLRFQQQINDDMVTDLWQLAYNHLKNQKEFREFISA